VFVALSKPAQHQPRLALAACGHLTHAARPNLFRKWFNAGLWRPRPNDARIDSTRCERLRQHPAQLIIAGGSAYSRISTSTSHLSLNFRRCRRAI